MQKIRSLLAIAIISASLTACGVKDADIEKAISSNPALSGTQTTVKDHVVTIAGEAKDEAAKTAYEAAAKAIKGVKNVVNNMTVTPPPTVTMPTINADDPILKGVTDAVKDLPSVKAAVKDGIVTLTGEIKKVQWVKLLQVINSLKPKKVESAGLTIK